MILYTGGRYQGKLNAVLSGGGYTDEDVYDFAKINVREYAEVDYRKKRIWYHLDDYIRFLLINGTDGSQTETMIRKLIDSGKPEVVIISETGSGVIPMNKSDNVFREITGRISVYVAENAEEVYRVVCGIKMKLK